MNHEILFGKGKQRDLSIFYGLQKKNINMEDHKRSHGRPDNMKEYRKDYKDYYGIKWCKELGLSEREYYKIKFIFEKNKKRRTKDDHDFLKEIKNKIDTIRLNKED